MKSNPPARHPATPWLQSAGALALIGVLGSCSEATLPPPPAAPPPPPVIATAPTVPAGPPPAADWREAGFTAGEWQWQPGLARFTSGGAVLFSLECRAATRTVRLVRPGATAASGAIELATTTLTRPLPAAAEPAAGLVAELPAGDPLLDAMAFSRGRFSVEASGAAPLVLPAWPEVARVVEDCRRP
ncbi:MAG: hypothetical protein JSS36_06035 [Proteobacteria bacterium]|nr:hypothetical protein [Pseudomonadota bacterium]